MKHGIHQIYKMQVSRPSQRTAKKKVGINLMVQKAKQYLQNSELRSKAQEPLCVIRKNAMIHLRQDMKRRIWYILVRMNGDPSKNLNRDFYHAVPLRRIITGMKPNMTPGERKLYRASLCPDVGTITCCRRRSQR